MTDSDDRIAILVHELRSPVAALAAIAESLRERDAPARRELVRLCLDACSAIERLVTDITVASVRPTLVDVGEIVRDAVLARSLARRRGRTRLTMSVDGALPLVLGDPVRLRQAIDNLLTNADVHGGEGIGIAAGGSDTAVTVAVSDDGPGIQPEELERVFEFGVRLDATRGGAGLGLAITRAIVEAHGGSLKAESSPGRGATFTMTLPSTGRTHPDT